MAPQRVIVTDRPDLQGTLHELPPWARAAAVIGIPGVIALYLVYMLANAIPTKLDAHAIETRSANAMQLQVLTQICLNTAKTPEEKTACWLGR